MSSLDNLSVDPVRNRKILWLTPYKTDKLWDPALRLRRYNVHEYIKHSITSNFIFDTDSYDYNHLRKLIEDSDVIVFTEQNEIYLRLQREAKRLGKFIIKDHCELMFGFPYQHESFLEADMVVCASTEIAQTSKKYGYNCMVIPDMFESIPKRMPRKLSKNDQPVAVFMGTGAAKAMVHTNKQYREAILDAGYKLIIISDTTEEGVVRWKQNTWQEVYLQADVILCPQDIWSFPGKSNVKLVQALGAGIPVVASPLTSYKEILYEMPNIEAGYIAYSPEDWNFALKALRNNSTRIRLSQGAIKLSRDYSCEAISQRWYNLFLGDFQIW
jgi:glycosyltransferase involved in cell wall biosynthesis